MHVFRTFQGSLATAPVSRLALLRSPQPICAKNESASTVYALRAGGAVRASWELRGELGAWCPFGYTDIQSHVSTSVLEAFPSPSILESVALFAAVI